MDADNTLSVLDHGYVRLIDHMGDDLSIVRAARVSFDAEWRAGDDTSSDERLIRYLMCNRHTSPFEAVTFTFEIKCPIFIARQWHRHRTWSYNEVSARYTELPEEVYIPEANTVGVQSADNKQARDLSRHGECNSRQYACELMATACDEAFETYRALLAGGVPRELARSVLPMSTYTRFFGTVDLHNLLHFLRLRLHEHAQYEIRVYAEALLALISPIVPVAVAAFHESRGEAVE